MKHFQPKMIASAVMAAVAALSLSGCLSSGGDDDDKTEAISQPNPGMHFNRVASFAVCGQQGSSCASDDVTAAEIVAASTDGMTLIYSNSPKGEIGFVDIANASAPAALGALAMGGEPTSVAVLGANVLVAVNTSASYTSPSGRLAVVDIATRKEIASIALPGQPDSVAVSKDGKYIAVVIENERDEDFGDGAPPQAPAGSLVIVDAVGAASTWKTRTVSMTGIAALYPTDPEPEYVDINEDNIAVVTLQENNHIALVDLKTGTVTAHFSAGSANLASIDATDERPNQINLNQSQTARLREPDGVTWISKTQFVTANEGDLNGGSRSFTVFNKDGTVAYEAGNALELQLVRLGHYNDRRSDAKGNEPENAEFGRFAGTDYLFVASERSSVVAVYDLSTANSPTYKQTLPAGVGPEGVLAIPGRNLLIAASEEDERDGVIRSVLNIYQYQNATQPNYPTVQSANRADGTPIPWSALSGLAAHPTAAKTVYSVEDSFFRANRIFEIDLSQQPAQIKAEIALKDSNGALAALAASLPDVKDANAFDDVDLAAMINADGTVNIDPEGIAVASAGGFWIASEGAGTVGDSKYPITKPNQIFRVDAAGAIQEVIGLPAELNAVQLRFGFEGIAEADGKLVVAFQRAWNGEANPRIGVYDLTARTWQFMFYPLDAVASANGGWVGLSDITALGGNRFLVVERDNQGGPDAAIKRLYRIDLSGQADGATLSKTLVRDLLPDLQTSAGPVPEKIEGLAVMADGEVVIVNDNDGVDGGNGETQLMRLGKLQ